MKQEVTRTSNVHTINFRIDKNMKK